MRLGFSALLFFLLSASAAVATCSLLTPSARAASGDLRGYHTLVSASVQRDVFFDIAEAPDGSVYLAGNLDQDPSGGTMLLVKFDAARNLLWQRTYRPAGATGAWAGLVATDSAGNAVVGGGCTDGGDADIALVKWSAAGTRLWTAVRDGGSGSSDWLTDIDVAADGAVCACGSIDGSDHAVVLKYARDADPANPLTGLEKWQYLVHGTASYAGAAAMGLTVDGTGNVYVAGERSTAAAERDAFALKLSPRGARRWLRSWDGAAHDNDIASRLALRGRELYVAVDTSTRRRGTDLALIKYDTAGHRRWVRQWDGGRAEADNVAGLACDGRGHVYAAVNSWLPDNGTKGSLIKYSAGGKRLWQRSYQGASGAGGALYYDAAVTRAGTAWVGGYVSRPGELTRWLTVRYAASGKRQWVRRWDGPSADPQGGQAWACRLVGSNSIVMAGEVRTTSSGPAACVLWRRR
jgi:hypothetical protein